jgi:hypothetical protein
MKPLFSNEDWQRVGHDWDAFWDRKLTRPMIFMEWGDPSIPEPQGFHRYYPQYPVSLSGKEIMEIETRRITRVRFLGDGLPRRFTNFGPGSMAPYFGSEPGWDDTTVWFKDVGKLLSEITLKMDRTCAWYKRVHEILDAEIEAFGREVVPSFSDMGGNLDILASVRGSENLLFDLMDCPETVEAKGREITREWLKNYAEESAKLKGKTRGFMPWAPIYSPTRTTYMLQCDFSYMISPDMFERFVMPDLTACCDFVELPFYHLDGKRQLPHLDHLLSIKKLRGVQWIPGAGQPPASQWPEVLTKIRQAGKLVQIYLSAEEALDLKTMMSLEGFIIEIGSGNLGVEELKEVYKKLIS